MKNLIILLSFTISFSLKSQTCTALYTFNANYETVRFYNQSNVSNAHFYWNFGDGTGSTIKEPEHKFPENGTYLVTLYVNDTVSNCSNYYEQWLNVTKFSSDPCSPVINDSIYFYNYWGTPAYYLKIIDNSANCSEYDPLYKVGYSSGPYDNTLGIGLYPGNFISTVYYFDENNAMKRAALKTSPNNFNRSKNYGPCSANFEFKVVSENNLGQRILFSAMNKNAMNYRWLITGFGNPIYAYTDTVSVYQYGNPNAEFPNLSKIMILSVNEQGGCADSLLQQFIVRPKSSTVVSVNELKDFEIQINVFPNPVNNKIMLDFDPNAVGLDKLSITNNLGQIIYKIDKPLARQEIELSFLSKGIYYLKVQNQEGQKIFKIVKE